MNSLLPAYALIGICGGLLAGLLGVGGGLVVVPALLWVLPYQGLAVASIPHSAVATSLATMVATSLASAYAQHRRGAIDWSITCALAPGLAMGALGGAVMAAGLPGGALRAIFGLFALAVATQMGLGLQVTRHGRLPAMPGLVAVGAAIGALSAIVGLGGGTLTVPFLQWGRVGIHRAVAISSTCAFPIAVGGSLGFILAATDHSSVAGGIYWPAALAIAMGSIAMAPVGVKWAHRLPTLWLTRIFALMLAMIGLRLILG